MNPWPQKIEPVYYSDITRWVQAPSRTLCGGGFELGAARAEWKWKAVAAKLVG